MLSVAFRRPSMHVYHHHHRLSFFGLGLKSWYRVSLIFLVICQIVFTLFGRSASLYSIGDVSLATTVRVRSVRRSGRTRGFSSTPWKLLKNISPSSRRAAILRKVFRVAHVSLGQSNVTIIICPSHFFSSLDSKASAGDRPRDLSPSG